MDYKSDYYCYTCEDVYTITKDERDEHEKQGHEISKEPMH